ncbi:hypothetical protein N8608_03235 [bacterium]|nr:hypothetical protein [bacterium]
MINFVTIVSDDYWPGAAALIHSVRSNACLRINQYQFSIICNLNAVPRRWLSSRDENINLLSINDLPVIEILTPQKQGRRMEVALQKLSIFALPSINSYYVYIDSDMICLGSLAELLSLHKFSICPDEIYGLGFDRSHSELSKVELNTGLMVFKPSLSAYQSILAYYQKHHQEISFKGDQDIINGWIKSNKIDVNYLSSEFNFCKRFQDKIGPLHTRALIKNLRILHYVGAKPWMSNTQIISQRECLYYSLERLWWKYFNSSRYSRYESFNVSSLTPFVRQFILPFIKPIILQESVKRIFNRLVKLFSKGKH